MYRLVCTFVVRKPPKTGFLASRPISYTVIFRNACFLIVVNCITLSLLLQTVSKFGGIDILVSNAATNPVMGPMLDVSKTHNQLSKNHLR